MTDKENPPAAATGRGHRKGTDSNCPGLYHNLPLATRRIIPPGQIYKQNGITQPVSRRWLFLVTKCPFCHRQHLHGGAPTWDELGPTRISHCHRGGEYKLVPEVTP